MRAVTLDCTEGFVVKNQFVLPDEDVHFLNTIESETELIQEGNTKWLIFRSYKIPDGYNLEVADLAILIPPHYPTTGLDMMYFNPALTRKDGAVIGALSYQSIEGKRYQRWSRHRTAANKWNPNIHNIESHVDLMVRCLIAEFAKR